MRDSLPRAVPLVILGAALLILFFPLLRGEVFFWGLPALQFYPWREYAFEMLLAGHLPLWNPYNGAGAPLLANYQTALFYPPTWAGLALPLASAMSVTVVLHLLLAGWGVWSLARRLGLDALASGVSALSFALSGYLVARLWVYPTVTAAAWIPWTLWAALGVIRHGRRRDIGMLGLVVGLQLLTGHAQTTWYGLLLTGVFALYLLARGRFARPDLLRRVGGLLLGGLWGVLLAAIQLIPTAELMLSSQRSDGVDYEYAMNFSYAPARTLNLLAPDVFGNPGVGTVVTQGAFFEDAIYIGLLPLVSALAALIAWATRRIRRARGEAPPGFDLVPLWAGVGLFGFIMALGQYSPIFPFLFEHVPTFDLFQAPVRWHIWTVFALSLLAGIGVGCWGRGKWLFFSTRLAVAGCLGIIVLGLWVVPNLLPLDIRAEAGVTVLLQAFITTAALGAVAGLLTLTQPDRGTVRHAAWAAVVLLFVAVDLARAAWYLNPTLPAEQFDVVVAEVGDDSGRGYWPRDVLQTVQFDEYLSFRDYGILTREWASFRASNLPNLNLLDRRYLLNNFDPLVVGHFARYLDLVEAHPDQWPILLGAAAHVERVYTEDGTPVPLEGTGPRAWFAASTCWHATEAELWAALADPGWSPAAQVHRVGEGDCPEARAEAVSGGTVYAVFDGYNSLRIDLTPNKGGALVLADTDYPGWRTVVDGVAVPIERANGVFRVVNIPPGAQSVTMTYQPGWLIPAGAGSVLGLLLILLLLRLREPVEPGPIA